MPSPNPDPDPTRADYIDWLDAMVENAKIALDYATEKPPRMYALQHAKDLDMAWADKLAVVRKAFWEALENGQTTT